MGVCGSPGQDLSMIIKSLVLSWYYTNCIYREKPSDKTQLKKPYNSFSMARQYCTSIILKSISVLRNPLKFYLNLDFRMSGDIYTQNSIPQNLLALTHPTACYEDELHHTV